MSFAGIGTLSVAGADLEAATSTGSQTLRLVNGALHHVTGWGNLLYAGSGSTITFENDGLLAATGEMAVGAASFINASTGTVQVDPGAELRLFNHYFTSTGTVEVRAGASLTVSSSNYAYDNIRYLQNAGTINVVNAYLQAGTISGGTLSILAGNYTNDVYVNHLTADYVSVPNGETLKLVAGASRPVAYLKTLALPARAGIVDINAGAMIIDYDGASPYADLYGKIYNGTHGGNGLWSANNDAIVSDAASHSAFGFGRLGIAIAEATTLYPNGTPSSLFGVPADDTTVIIDCTYMGDANLDGKVDISDLALLATHYGRSGSWTDGDFDYNGIVNISDLTYLADNWGIGVTDPTLPFAQALAKLGLTVPEPTNLGLVGTAALSLLLRRRN